MSALKCSYDITVKTGDRKKAGTDANIYITLIDSDGGSTFPTKLDNLFRDDFERGRTDKFTIKDPVDIKKIERIELWRDNAGIGAEWFVDTIEIKNAHSETPYIFPLYRWIKADYKYKISHMDNFLPQEDPQKIQRKMELEDKKNVYTLTQKVPGCVAQVSFTRCSNPLKPTCRVFVQSKPMNGKVPM